jgi:O-antigen/teichoic acid export membrane protein
MRPTQTILPATEYVGRMTTPLEGRSRGFAYILAATVVGGVFGYLIQLLAPRLLPDADSYLAFSVFWSTLFLFGSAIAGVQHEVTRATRPAESTGAPSPLRRFALIGTSGLVAMGAGLCVLLAPVAFQSAPGWMSLWFVVGLVGYFLSAVRAGVLYGLSRWRAVAILMGIDAILRGVAVTIGFLLQAPPGVLAALVALPFGIAVAVVWVTLRSSVVGHVTLDVPLRRLMSNAGHTIVAAASTAIMVTGLPLLLRMELPEENAETLASLTLAITLTRAPLIIPLIAFQSFLIVEFRAAGEHLWRRVSIYAAVLASITVPLAAAAWAWGPAILGWISGGRYDVSAATMAIVVVSAGLVALMCLTGPALLSEARHRAYVAGWIVAATATIALLLIPLPAVERTMITLLAAPALGLGVHAINIRSLPRARGREPQAPSVE